MEHSNHDDNGCIFCKIARSEIPSAKVFEDDRCFAFQDTSPVAPTHILLVPKEHIKSLSEAASPELLGHLLWIAKQIANSQKLNDGYRIIINTGEQGGQTVSHLHLHILAGRNLSWPPG